MDTLPSILDDTATIQVKREPIIEKPSPAVLAAGLEGAAWVIVIVAAALAAVVLIAGMATATGAPQEAVVCALACAIVILPYCAARGVAHLRRLDDK
jgi:hypothetical protein